MVKINIPKREMKDTKANLKIRVSPELKKTLEQFIKEKKRSEPDKKWNLNNFVLAAIADFLERV